MIPKGSIAPWLRITAHHILSQTYSPIFFEFIGEIFVDKLFPEENQSKDSRVSCGTWSQLSSSLAFPAGMVLEILLAGPWLLMNVIFSFSFMSNKVSQSQTGKLNTPSPGVTGIQKEREVPACWGWREWVAYSIYRLTWHVCVPAYAKKKCSSFAGLWMLIAIYTSHTDTPLFLIRWNMPEWS